MYPNVLDSYLKLKSRLYKYKIINIDLDDKLFYNQLRLTTDNQKQSKQVYLNSLVPDMSKISQNVFIVFLGT